MCQHNCISKHSQVRPSAYDSLELKIKQTSPWITLFIINSNSLSNKLWGFLHGGWKILEGRTTFCWVYVQKYYFGLWLWLSFNSSSWIWLTVHSTPWAIKHWLLLSSALSTLSFGLMLYLGNKTGPKYWTSSESSQSSAHGNTKWNSFYLLWLPTERPAAIWSGLSLILGSSQQKHHIVLAALGISTTLCM